jgi:hypothetical protein
MGSEARIYEFDHRRYTREVVPALHRLLLTGEMVPWLRALWHDLRREWIDSGPEYTPYNDLDQLRGADLRRDCTYLRGDLAYLWIKTDVDPQHDPWESRAWRIHDCPSRHACPHHIDVDSLIGEDVHRFFNDVVILRCCGKSQFVGRSADVSWYRDLLDPQLLPARPSARALLEALGSRGYVVGYNHADGGGVRGWLSALEARQLGEALSALDLPDYARTYEGMQRELETLRGTSELHKGDRDTLERLNANFDQLSLSFVRTVCLIASGDGRGVLWGNDVDPIVESESTRRP